MIKDIDYIVTDTHLEARLLECNLIKEHKPRFNAQMKNDQRYFFIKIEDYNRYHPMSIVGERTENCFGPFRSKYTISVFLDKLKNLYPIIQTENGYEFEYHMFPVTMDEEAYHKNRDMLLTLFRMEENIPLFMKALQSKLEDAVIGYRYEMASVYRDMINCFRMIKNGLDGYKSLATRDILLTIPIEEGYKLFYVASSRIVHSLSCSELTQDIRETFMEECIARLSLPEDNPGDEKMWIDFRDILYSEISDLPEEMVEKL
jgi:excinuclease ABC subunit C